MRLNPDLIREILLTVEENTGYGKHMDYPGDYLLLNQYTDEEIMYHIQQCELSGLLTKVHYFLGGGCTIVDLSPVGHEFISNIRNDNNWNKTKEVAKNVGSFSLNVLAKIASNIVEGILKSQF